MDDSSRGLQQVLLHLKLTVPTSGELALTDQELLARFVRRRDEAAFAALFRRHSPMVTAVCRRVSRHTQDAEDVVQAVFLLLVHKAKSLAKRTTLSGFLYESAYRMALRAKSKRAKQKTREEQVENMPHPEAPAVEIQDWIPLLYRELNRLSAKYRDPIILCDLEGQTRKYAAAQLGVPEGTLSSRLAAARKMLAQRLSRRGVVLSTAALVGAFAQDVASAQVSTSLVASTTKLAVLVATGQMARMTGSAAILLKGVLKAMLIKKIKISVVMLFAMTAIGATGGVIYRSTCLQASTPENKRDTDIDDLRNEMQVLKLELQAVREKVRVQEATIQRIREQVEADAKAVNKESSRNDEINGMEPPIAVRQTVTNQHWSGHQRDDGSGKQVLVYPRNEPLALDFGYPAQSGAAPVPSCLLAGNKLQNFALADLNGQRWEYRRDHRGRLVLLDFWGTWCAACKDGILPMRALHNAYGPYGLEVIGIAYERGGTFKEQATRIRGAGGLMGFRYPILMGSGDACPVLNQFDVHVYPTRILLDESGRIVWRSEGGDHIRALELEQEIKRRLKAGSAETQISIDKKIDSLKREIEDLRRNMITPPPIPEPMQCSREPEPKPHYLNTRRFRIPIHCTEDRSRIRQILLFSRSPGANQYFRAGVAAPSDEGFPFHAEKDGLYRFKVATLDKELDQWPSDISTEPVSLTVAVDTAKPDVRITATERRGDDVVVCWRIREDHADLKTLRLEYRTDEDSKSDWKSVEIEQTLGGKVTIKPGTSDWISLRMKIRDKAGNEGEAETVVPAATVP